MSSSLATRRTFCLAEVRQRLVLSKQMLRIKSAQQLGVPSEAVFEERSSLTTLDNIRNSKKIMDSHHWDRVEVISSPDHLHRAAVILSETTLQWRIHDAPTPGRGLLNRAMGYTKEAIATTILRWFGDQGEPVIHTVAYGIRIASRMLHSAEF